MNFIIYYFITKYKYFIFYLKIGSISKISKLTYIKGWLVMIDNIFWPTNVSIYIFQTTLFIIYTFSFIHSLHLLPILMKNWFNVLNNLQKWVSKYTYILNCNYNNKRTKLYIFHFIYNHRKKIYHTNDINLIFFISFSLIKFP